MKLDKINYMIYKGLCSPAPSTQTALGIFFESCFVFYGLETAQFIDVDIYLD